MRKELELVSTIRCPAEGEAYRVQQVAEGKKYVRCQHSQLFIRFCVFGCQDLLLSFFV